MTTCSTNVCGTGDWSGPLPGDPDNNSALTASPAFGGIDVSWTYPAVNPEAVAYVKLFRGVSADFNTAFQIAVVTGDRYYDKIDSNLRYYYWIQIASVNGTVGSLIGPAAAVARPLINDLLVQLTDKIDSGVLAQSLRTDIDKIALNHTAFLNQVQSWTDAQNAYSSALTQMQAGVDDMYATLQQELTSRQDGDSLLAQAINTAQTVLGNNIASAQTTLQSNINTVNGKVTDIGARYTAKVNVNGLVGGFGVYNDGTSVEAGFDVSTFWVGSTNANKKKPFIISNGETFIDQAVIQTASIDIAKINKATIQNLSALNADMGSINAGQIKFTQPGAPLNYIVIDNANQSIRVFNNGMLRVKIGNLA
jgi:hypothetical protein